MYFLQGHDEEAVRARSRRLPIHTILLLLASGGLATLLALWLGAVIRWLWLMS